MLRVKRSKKRISTETKKVDFNRVKLNLSQAFLFKLNCQSVHEQLKRSLNWGQCCLDSASLWKPLYSRETPFRSSILPLARRPIESINYFLSIQILYNLCEKKNRKFSKFFGIFGKMTCPQPPSHKTALISIPIVSYFSRNFHAPIFKTVTITNTVSVVFLPTPLKIVPK